jgi:hypothetical protein
LFNDKKEDIFIELNNKIKVSKNKTDKFDSFFFSKKVTEIDLKNPKKDISFY